MRFILALLILSSLAGISKEVLANTDELVTSIHHGGNPFMVVTKDEEGGSHREPGIYGRSQESWRQILTGSVLQDARKGFWLKQLKLSQKDELYHTLIIVDGRLQLMNLFSDPALPGSALTIGSKEFPLIEVLTGQKRTLPQIKSVDDISVLPLETSLEETDFQLVLVSVRCDSCSGDGITFAMAIKPMAKGQTSYEFVGRPWLLDYKYYPQATLNELMVAETVQNKKSFRLRSGVATDFLLNTDFSVFRHHQDIVKVALDRLLAKNLSGKLPPVEVDLATGQLAGMFSPVLSFHNEAQTFKFHQQYDMRSHIGRLRIVNEGEEVRNMLMDFKAAGKPAIFGEKEGNSLTIFSADGKLYLAIKSYGISIVELGESPSTTGKDFEVHELFVKMPMSLDGPVESGVTRKILFLSTKFADGSGKVDAYRLAYYSTGAIIVEDRFTVHQHGLNQEELAMRVREAGAQILFDSLTPKTENAEEYKQAFDRAKPLVNVSQSTAQKTAYAFGEPLHMVSAQEFFDYREYAPSPLISNPTGIYPRKVGVSQTKPSLGEILTRDERAEGELLNEIPALSDIASIKNENLGSIAVKIMAIDPTFAKGTKGFKLVAAISSNERKFSTMLVEIPFSFPYKNLLSVRTYLGRKNFEKNLVIVLTFEKEVDGKMKGETMALSVKISAERGAIPTAAIDGKEMVLAKEALDSTQVIDRMVYDEEGRLHFVSTPNVPRDERRFEMFNIFDRRTFKPAVEKGIKLLWDSKPNEEADHFEERKIAWRLPTTELDKRFPFIPKRTKDAEAGYLWGKLFTMLDELAQTKTGGKMKVLIVPETMKRYVNEVILTRYGRRTKERESNPFNWSNRNLKVYQVDGEASTQDDFLDNLDQISRQTQGANVILADMAVIGNIGEPEPKASNFHLRNVSTPEDDDDEQEFGEDTRAEENVKLPHALYLLAAGEPIQMDELKKKTKRNYSTLFVSTPDEWELVKTETEDEMEAGLDDMIEVIDFPLPTPEDRARLLGQIFEDKNIRIFRYGFDAKGISRNYSMAPEAQMTKLMEYAVMRVASEAENAGMDGLNAFVSFRNLFAQELLRDRTIRRSAMIDKAFIERVLTSVFDIPVNLESLPPDDPIFILSRKDAVRKLQDRGVEGPFALKARVIKTMLSILKSDPTKSIPSSHIFIGESGSGKTRMVTGLLDWLFPNKYDFNNPNRTYDANSIRINVGKMVESRKEGRIGEQLTFEDVREHINNFLINGFRGAIFLDDFHAAPESVRTQLLGFIRTLLETQGLYNTQSLDGSYSTQVPLRHLHLFINLNPTENQTQIDSFRKKKDQPATFEEVLLASLSTKDMKVERSLLRRWGAIHNLMQFPHGAKAPALSKDILATARDIMLRKQKLVINSAGSIRAVADQFPDMDARTFLSTASSALVDQVDPQLYSGNLFHVVPGRRFIKMSLGQIGSGINEDNSEKGKIEHFVERNTKILPLNDSTPESQLQFIRTLMRNYRLPVFEQLTISLEDDPRFSESIDSQRNFLLPALMGVRDHVTENSEIPLSELNLDPVGLGLKTAADKALFRDILAEIAPYDVKHFPFPISKTQHAGGWDILITGKSDSTANSRSAMITKYFHRVSEVIQKHAKKFYNLESLEGAPNPEQWLRKLPAHSNEASIKPSIEELRELYFKFIADINDPTLRDRSEINDSHFTPYTIARIFYFMVDKAMTELPWIMINKHIIRALDHVVEDQVLGQSPAVKSYFFDYKYSPIRASNPELILQLVESSQLSAEYTTDSQQNVRKDYLDHCARLLEVQ